MQQEIIDYFFLVQSMLKSNDLISAVELLQEMQDNGFVLDTRGEYAGLYHDIFVELTKVFRKGGVGVAASSDVARESRDGDDEDYDRHYTSSAPSSSASTTAPARRNFINDFYLALVDQAQSKDSKPVPRIVLDVVFLLISQDYKTTREQSYSLFENYKTIFRQEPSPMSYTTLLKTIVFRRQGVNEEDVLNVFQDFERRFIFTENTSNDKEKNEFDRQMINIALSKCYDLLYISMLKRKDLALFEDIWNHMLAEHAPVLPSLHACRRLLMHFTMANDEEKASLMLTALEKLYYDKFKVTTLPIHLLDQLQTFVEVNLQRKEGHVAEKTPDDSDAKDGKDTILDDYL